jgi:hypothetical protein
MLCRCARGGDACGLCQRSVRRRKNPPGAILDHDELHDDLQFASRDVPSRLLRTAGTGGRFDNIVDRTGPGSRPQFNGEHDVRHELHDDAAELSNRLLS